MDKPDFKRLQQGLAENFEVLYWAIDSAHTVL